MLRTGSSFRYVVFEMYQRHRPTGQQDGAQRSLGGLEKVATGIDGFDAITGGGIPQGRTTLICGPAGSGKTLFGAEFLVRGATLFDEPGVFVSFEERDDELVANVASLGFELGGLIERQMITIDHVEVGQGEIEQTGDYDLEGLFVRLGFAIDSIRAKRVVIDTLEGLFAAFTDTRVLRMELRRLFRWLKERGVTAVITAERGDGTLTRHGLEEYVSDCVITLDQRASDRVVTRYLRVMKYRGSEHGSNEYPFLIHGRGISVMPITSIVLDHPAPTDRVSLGIPRLDAMLSGGVYRASSVLISGVAGTGKSSIGAHAVDASCRRGEPCFYFAFEESPEQIIRNMRSIGVELEPWVEAGLLTFYAARPTMFGLEMHLMSMAQRIEDRSPSLVVVDPISSLGAMGPRSEVRSMLMRLVDLLKRTQVTGLFISLSQDPSIETEASISSIMDTWLVLRTHESNGERNRSLSVLKSRGMGHSNQVREFVISDGGVELTDVYVGSAAVLMGTARRAREARDAEEAREQEGLAERKRRELERRRALVDARIETMRAELDIEAAELESSIRRAETRARTREELRAEMAQVRRADAVLADDGREVERVRQRP